MFTACFDLDLVRFGRPPFPITLSHFVSNVRGSQGMGVMSNNELGHRSLLVGFYIDR